MAEDGGDGDGGSSGAPFYRDPLKVVGLIGGIISVVIGGTQIYERMIKPDPASVSVQYVLDVSKGMRGAIGGRSKFAAARAEILDDVRRHENVSHGLRLAGPGCSDEPRPLAVGYGQDNAEEFEEHLGPLSPGGKSDFVNSVRDAIDDLVGQTEVTTATMFVYVGDSDRCTERAGEKLANSLRNLNERRSVDITFKFIGVRVPKDMLALLRRTKRNAQELGFTARVRKADTPQELENAADDLETSPSG
jgi:hypothetical protein